jgi:RNA polymerase primary sigma factor
VTASRRWSAPAEAQILGRYLREIGKFPRLSVEEERELGRRIREGDEEATRRLVESNLRFVVSYAKHYRGMGVSVLDLIHEGNLGLVEAARRFDPERNVKFISYAVWWVRQAMIQALSDHARAFSVPSRLAAVFSRLEKKLGPEAGEQGTPGPEEMAASLEVSVDDLNALLRIRGRNVSLSDSVGREGDLEVADLLEQEAVPAVEAQLMREALQAKMQQLLGELSAKEAEVISLRFGLGEGGEPLTLQEIGDRLELSRERVRQIESKAMAKLRRSDRAQKMRGFLN